MAKKEEATIDVVVEEVEEKKNMVLDSAHKVLLVGFGAVGMGQDLFCDGRKELSKLFNKLVDRGEEMEKEGREWINDIVDRNKKIKAEAEIVVETA